LRNNALKINEKDNVVIAISDIKKGETVVINGEILFNAAEDIDAGHKIALQTFHPEEKVLRYGEAIVQATQSIERGAWVHVHNTEPIPGDMTE
jgi:altronate hydrolase